MRSTYFVTALYMSATTTAYVVDTTSCSLVARTFIADKLACAFDMASNAASELRGPIRQEVQNLMDHLWSPTINTASYPTAQEAILCTQYLIHRVQFWHANHIMFKVDSQVPVRKANFAQTTSSTKAMMATVSLLVAF